MISRFVDWLASRRAETPGCDTERASERTEQIAARVEAQWPEVHAHARVSARAREHNHFAESIRRALREA